MLRTAPRTPIIWWAGIAFAFMLGCAATNSYVTHSAINAERGACHWTIQHELRRQRSILESQ